MTIKQFGFLAFGAALAAILFFIVPKVFFLNFIVAAIPALLGFGFGFVPINDRPMDIWLRNMFKRLFSPTQYFYRKNNRPPKILLGLELPPREILLQHIKAQQSLNEYLQKKPKTDARDNMDQVGANISKKTQELQSLMVNSGLSLKPVDSASLPNINPTSKTVSQTASQPGFSPLSQPPTVEVSPTEEVPNNLSSSLSLSGTVLGTNGIPLANQMVYIKKGEETVRLFKTNQKGQFQNNLPLSPGEYLLEITDPQKKHDFARMKINHQSSNLQIFAQKWIKNQLHR